MTSRSDRNESEVAGILPVASPSSPTRILLTRPILRELRMTLLGYASPFSVELELVEQRYENGDVVVRLARHDRRDAGETILGAYNEHDREPTAA